MNDHNVRVLRAAYTAETITVYQAYAPPIADAAVRAGTFVRPFNRDRMTWVKPSFGWMMHRSGWATKPGQERVLAIEISRDGFEWALSHSCLSHFTLDHHSTPQDWATAKASSPVRVQWDPDEWIRSVADITTTVRQVEQLVRADRTAETAGLLPPELVYPLDPVLAQRIDATHSHPVQVGPPGGTR